MQHDLELLNAATDVSGVPERNFVLLMNTREKAQEEWLIMRSFRDAYPDFPKGKLTKSESPDFTLKLSVSNAIGIEISSLHHNPASKGDESLLRSIIFKARALYLERLKNPVFAHIFFDNSIAREVNDEFYSTKLAIAIINVVSEQKIGAKYVIILEKEFLPAGVNRIILYAHPSFKKPVWSLKSEITTGDLTDPDNGIEAMIKKKEDKIGLYRKNILDNYWLLLNADYINRSTVANINKHLTRIKPETQFNKVFFYNLFDQKYFELK